MEHHIHLTLRLKIGLKDLFHQRNKNIAVIIHLNFIILFSGAVQAAPRVRLFDDVEMVFSARDFELHTFDISAAGR